MHSKIRIIFEKQDEVSGLCKPVLVIRDINLHHEALDPGTVKTGVSR